MSSGAHLHPRAGVWIALLSILVQAPRLVVGLLAADRLEVSPAWRVALLVVTGVGTALVLALGSIYLAHTVAGFARARGLLLIAWGLLLACSGVLSAPVLVAGLSGEHLHEVLSTARQRWCWSAAAVLAHELVVAGCMLGAVVAQHGQQPAGLQAAPRRQGTGLVLLGLNEPRTSVERPAAQPRATCRRGCGWSGSVMGERAHQRHCPRRLAHEARRNPTGPRAAVQPLAGIAEVR